MRIGVIHATLNAVEPLTEAIYRREPSAQVLNFVNEELLYHANQVNGVDDWGVRNFTRLMMMAAESSVDGIIIACSLYSGYAGLAKTLTAKPVIAIDQPMIEEAVKNGNHIGILATTASAGPTEEAKILAEAKRTQKKIKTSTVVSTEAMKALKAGDKERHNRLLYECGRQLKEMGCDTLVLSQITMACAAKEMDDLGLYILTSPESGARNLIQLINDERRCPNGDTGLYYR